MIINMHRTCLMFFCFFLIHKLPLGIWAPFRLWKHLNLCKSNAWEFHLPLGVKALTDSFIELFIDQTTDSLSVSPYFLYFICVRWTDGGTEDSLALKHWFFFFRKQLRWIVKPSIYLFPNKKKRISLITIIMYQIQCFYSVFNYFDYYI